MPWLRSVTFSRASVIASLVMTSVNVTAQDPQGPSRSAQLDEASLREAITYGEAHTPQPYLLYPKPGERGEATIAVYTAFVRVAMAAHTARQLGQRLSPGALPQWIAERDIHVVVRPFSASASMARALYPEDPPLAQIPITQIALQRRSRIMHLDFIPPRWLTRDLSYLTALGGLPFPDAVAAAAFDPDLMVDDVDVYGWWRKENQFFPSTGSLNQAEMKSWR